LALTNISWIAIGRPLLRGRKSQRFILPQLIKPGNVKVVTNDGEVQVTIALELTINLNSDGLVVNARQQEEQEAAPAKNKAGDKTLWEIPDFGPIPKVDFGKKE